MKALVVRLSSIGDVVHTLPAGARFDLAERRLLSFVEEHLAHQLKHQTEED